MVPDARLNAVGTYASGARERRQRRTLAACVDMVLTRILDCWRMIGVSPTAVAPEPPSPRLPTAHRQASHQSRVHLAAGAGGDAGASARAMAHAPVRVPVPAFHRIVPSTRSRPRRMQRLVSPMGSRPRRVQHPMGESDDGLDSSFAPCLGEGGLGEGGSGATAVADHPPAVEYSG
eukprot:gene14757-biopygen5797